MAKTDIPFKQLFQRRPTDWVRYVEPKAQEDWIRQYQTNFAPKKESRLDNVFEVEAPQETYFVNFEPMGYFDVALPARMLRYRSDIWESTLCQGKGTPPIRQVVIFLYKHCDNKNHQLSDRWRESITLDYNYKVIRVWQEFRKTVIDNELVGLYPLLPLMKGDKEREEPRQVLKESIAVVSKVKDESLKLDLLAALAIMAGGKYEGKLIHSLIRREMIMESPIYQEWVKEERAEAEARGEARGIDKGKAEKAQDAICKILNKRLGVESLPLQHKVRVITSESALDWILDQVIDVTTKEAAQDIINTAILESIQ
ncbi:hypothetical protein [Desulfotomaculum sp. 1211_IL3151]|uniref:hypothetical protein n=1 Tax=Desulfotomaculum sp. 1211_IL3151 TaxID=3084055 RepID=UPI002FDB7D4E